MFILYISLLPSESLGIIAMIRALWNVREANVWTNGMGHMISFVDSSRMLKIYYESYGLFHRDLLMDLNSAMEENIKWTKGWRIWEKIGSDAVWSTFHNFLIRSENFATSRIPKTLMKFLKFQHIQGTCLKICLDDREQFLFNYTWKIRQNNY